MLIIADNLQITQKAFKSAFDLLDRPSLQVLVRKYEEAGAQAFDINPGRLDKNPEEKMTFLLEAIESATSLPLLLDAPSARVMRAGLQAAHNKAILNGFSLESEKISTILPLAAEYDCPVVGFLLRPDGNVPTGIDERLNLAVELFQVYSDAGLSPENLIIDPVLTPLIWNDGPRQAMDLLEVIKLLPECLGFRVKTILGLSNLTAGKGWPEKRRIFEEAYACMLATAGLDMILLNILSHRTVSLLKACQSLSRGGIFSWHDVL